MDDRNFNVIIVELVHSGKQNKQVNVLATSEVLTVFRMRLY